MFCNYDTVAIFRSTTFVGGTLKPVPLYGAPLLLHVCVCLVDVRVELLAVVFETRASIEFG